MFGELGIYNFGWVFKMCLVYFIARRAHIDGRNVRDDDATFLLVVRRLSGRRNFEHLTKMHLIRFCSLIV